MFHHITNLPKFLALAAIFAAAAAQADPVTITNQPKNLTVLDKAPYALYVAATGSDPISYQWYRNGAKIEGATSARYTAPAATAKDDGSKFHVVVSNQSDGQPASVTSEDVTMHVVTLGAALKHRYSFEKDASDSAGHADGTLMGAAVITNGAVQLNGRRGTYVNLPGGMIAGFDSVSFEFWASLGTNRNYCRVFDQGSTNGNNGEHDLYFCPHFGQDFRLTVMDPHPREKQARARGNLDNTTNLQVVCVLDPAAGFMGFYTNGVLAASNTAFNSLASVETNYFFLGKSLFGGDAPLNGSIDEFRIYNVALSPDAVAASYKAGPNAAIKP